MKLPRSAFELERIDIEHVNVATHRQVAVKLLLQYCAELAEKYREVMKKGVGVFYVGVSGRSEE